MEFELFRFLHFYLNTSALNGSNNKGEINKKIKNKSKVP